MNYAPPCYTIAFPPSVTINKLKKKNPLPFPLCTLFYPITFLFLLPCTPNHFPSLLLGNIPPINAFILFSLLINHKFTLQYTQKNSSIYTILMFKLTNNAPFITKGFSK